MFAENAAAEWARHQNPVAGLGAAAIWLGATAGRRFTAWIGVASVVGAVLSVVGDTFEDSPTGAGITLALIGVAAVVGATLLEARSDA